MDALPPAVEIAFELAESLTDKQKEQLKMLIDEALKMGASHLSLAPITALFHFGKEITREQLKKDFDKYRGLLKDPEDKLLGKLKSNEEESDDGDGNDDEDKHDPFNFKLE